MAGFERNRKYRPTVPRSIRSSRAMRRWDHLRSCRLQIVSCRLTLRKLDMPHFRRTIATQRSCLSFQKVAGFEASNSDHHWLVLTDR